MTAKLAAGGYLMLTEANLVNYTDLAVRPAGGRRIEAFFHADKEGFEQSGEGVTPWRVTLAARDLNALANSDIVKNLCPPPSDPSLAARDFCRPGRCIWQWLPAGNPVYAEQRDWYDKTKALGFEYYLIDAGWRKWQDGDKDQWACLKEVIAYGLSIGVKTAVWVHSNEVPTPETRLPYLRRVKECGAVGIKIDFMPPANHVWTQWYEETSRDCAEVGLFVDYHGAVKPTGRERTWPHELAREAIRGHEWHITRYGRVLPRSHDCILPFCRLVQGRADYTPMVFEQRELIHFTWARELAQGVVFSAPFLCFGDRPGTYLESPMADFVKTIPAIYDETICLPGSEIGGCAAFAKRSGDAWFLAALNGDEGRAMKIDLAFLGGGKWKMLAFGDGRKRDKWGVWKLDDCTKDERVVTAADVLDVVMRDGGGFAARFTKLGDVAGTPRRVRVDPVDGDATAMIQGEIDRAFAAGGGTVVVGRGEWRVKSLRLRSRVTLHLESGATILGSRNPEDYFILDADTVEPVPREWITHEAWTHEQSCSVDNFTRFPASRWNNGLIRLLGAEDAAIIGEPGSVIDGCNPFDPIGEEFYRGPQGISAINCRRLVLKGYTIRQTGNWAHRIADTADLLVENVTCEAGHDGVHVNGCDNVTIRKCVMKTGDDCVAGFDNSNVLVEDCYLNTACSGFRFAGTGVTIRRCKLKGPAEYGFRGSLSKEDKVAGAPSGKAKRNNMLSFFTYYSDGTHPVRRNAGKIEIVDCTSDDTDRLLHYNYGNEQWQRGKPMTDISFRNVRATRIKMPVSLWGDGDVPVRILFKDCEIAFSAPQKEFIRGAYISAIDLDNVKVSGVENAPLLRLWHADALRPVVRIGNVVGVGGEVKPAETAWNVKGI